MSRIRFNGPSLLSPSANGAAIGHFAAMIQRRRELVWEMTRREILDRYSGQVLGALWAIGNPLLLMGVYVVAFTLVFRGRLPGQADDPLRYAIYLLAGLAPWVAMQEALARAPTAVVGHANLVKQIVFPSEILPLRVALGVAPTLSIGVFVVLVLSMVAGVWRMNGVPLLIGAVFCHIAMTTGLCYLLAAAGVFVRDIKDVVAFLLSIGLFLHPIFYTPGSTPRVIEAMFHASPLSYLIWCYRDALFYGAITRPWIWVATPVLSVLIFAVGYRTYRMLQPAFGNAL